MVGGKFIGVAENGNIQTEHCVCVFKGESPNWVSGRSRVTGGSCEGRGPILVDAKG